MSRNASDLSHADASVDAKVAIENHTVTVTPSIRTVARPLITSRTECSGRHEAGTMVESSY